jgi:hypothetical protein
MKPTPGGFQREGVCRRAALTTQPQDAILDAKWRISKSWNNTVAPKLGVAHEAIVEASVVELVDQDERSVCSLHAAPKLGSSLL